MPTKLQPWTEEQLMRREDVFEALTAKALKQTMKQVTAGLQGIVTAAATPPPAEEAPVVMPEVPSNVAPPFSLTLLETAVTATWQGFVGNELFPFLVDTFIASAKQVATGVSRVTGERPEVFTSDFAANALALANNRMVNIGNQVWTQIQDQLSEGFAAGEGIQQLASRLNTVAGLSTPRALVTARTEVIGAANAGAYEQMVFSGFTDDEVDKEWLATEDPRTRKSHREADGQRVGLHQPFVVDVVKSEGGVDVTVGTENLRFPGDPEGSAGNVINCRCSIGFVFADDADDDDAQEQDAAMIAAGFDESKVKRDNEGKFAKKASRALGGVDKLSGKKTTPGKSVMLRTKVLFGTTYPDRAVIAVRSESDERIVWDEATEKVHRQKKNADGKYETVESLTRGATYAKYGNETGWTYPTDADTTPAAPTTPVDPSPTTPAAPKVAEKASEGVSETGTKPTETAKLDFQLDHIKTALANPAVPGGFVFGKVGDVEVRKGFTYPGEKVAPLLLFKDEATATIINGKDVPKLSDEQLNAQIATLQATPSKKKPKVSLSQGLGSMLAKASPGSTTPVPLAKPDDKQVKLSELNPANLKFTGKVVGTHGGKIYRDEKGGEWLFKKNSPALAEVDKVTADLHAMVGFPTPDTALMTVEGQSGSIQRMIPDAKDAFGYSFKPKDLSSADIDRLQAEQVFDWLVSNHDGHAGQFLRTPDGKLVGIDKGQSFKWFGADKLNWDFHPNPMEREPVYNAMWKAHINGEITMQDPSKAGNAINPFLKRLEHIPDSVYREMLRPYAEKAAKQKKLALGGPATLGLKKQGFASNDVEAFLDAAVARKNNLTQDFANLYSTAELMRKAKTGSSAVPSAPIVITAPTPSPLPGVNVTPTVKQKPKYMSHGALQNPKTTQYADGQVIAERQDSPVRLRWNGKTKKYDLERKSQYTNTWFVDQSFSKQAAYKKFGGAEGWFEPVGDTNATNQAAGVPSAPSVAGNPTAPVVAPKPKPVKTKKFSHLDLLAQWGDVYDIDATRKSQIFSNFKFNQPGKSVTLQSTGAKMFQAAVDTVVKHNKRADVLDGTIKPINLLQVLRIVDERSTPSGLNNQNNYEKAVVAWLQSPSGKANVQKYIDADGSMTSLEDANKKAAVDKKAQLEEVTAGLSKPSTAKMTEADFAYLQPHEAASMQKEMWNIRGSEWTTSERAAIKRYTGAAYAQINGNLRQNGDDSKLLNVAVNIQKGMLPATRDFVVRRGTSAAQFGFNKQSLTNDELNGLVGKTFQDKGFVSTSINGGFSGSVKLRILVPKGSPIAYVKSVSSHAHEEEILLAAGTKFEVVAVEESTGMYGSPTVIMRIVP